MTTEPTAIAPPYARTAGRRGRWLVKRWPAALAVALAAPGFLDDPSGVDDLAWGLGNVLILLQLGYLVLAKLQRRSATWPVVVVGTGAVVAVRALDVVSPASVLTALALVVLTWSVLDGQLRREREIRIQAAALLVFAGIAFLGLAVLSARPTLGTWVIAVGWLLHGLWDFVHLKRDKVVARSFAEWCGVIDVLLAVQLVVMLAAR